MSDGGIGNPPVIFCKNDSPLYTRGPFTLFEKLEFIGPIHMPT